jgi:PadR family transcriptional regulator PadR
MPDSSWIKEFRKGSTVIIVLKLLQEQPMYGYMLAQELSKRSNGYFEFKQGTLYPALHKMEQDGLVVGNWDAGTQDGPPRKYYHITEAGRKALVSLSEEWNTFTSKLGGLLF